MDNKNKLLISNSLLTNMFKPLKYKEKIILNKISSKKLEQELRRKFLYKKIEDYFKC